MPPHSPETRAAFRSRRRLRRAALVASSAAFATALATGCTVDTAAPAAEDPSAGASAAAGEFEASSPAGSDVTAGPSASPSATPGGATGRGLDAVPQVAARLQPSVVTVLVGGGNGSGVVYSSDGLILTNEHVVRGARSVQIAFADGQRVRGTVRAVDAITDLALVQADRRGLPAARFRTELPEVGSLAVVLGAPLGFQNSVTAGVISGLHREIPGTATRGQQSLVDLLQTDAPISPGNSGGAVANADGEVIGISEAYIPPQQGAVALGFAIPAATAVNIADQLRRTGRARHAYAGVQPAEITPEIASQLGLDSTDGVIVANVVPGGPAERARLVPGDVITAVDGEPTNIPEDFLAELRQHKPGDVVTLTVRRDGGAERQVRITVADRPVDTDQ